MQFKVLKYIISTIFLLSVVFNGSCSINDDSTKLKNSVYLELFGTGYYYSLNYERVILSKNKSSINLRSGLNWHPFTYHKGGGTNIHFGLSYFYFLSKKFDLEFGIYPDLWIVYQPIPETKALRDEVINNPQSWGLPYEPPSRIYLTALIGIRYNLKKDWFLKINYCAYFSLFPKYSYYGKDIYYLNWGGLSFGKKF